MKSREAQDARASALRRDHQRLPRELSQRSLEFLPVREAAARRQLISSEFFSEASTSGCSINDDEGAGGRWRSSPRKPRSTGRFKPGADVSSWHETFKEVWALESPEVVFEPFYCGRHFRRYAALRAGQFLKIVEPNIEGLSRIVAACELAQEAYGDGDNAPAGCLWEVGRRRAWATSCISAMTTERAVIFASRPSAGRGDNYRSRVLDHEAAGSLRSQARLIARDRPETRGELRTAWPNTMVILTRRGRMILCVRTAQ